MILVASCSSQKKIQSDDEFSTDPVSGSAESADSGGTTDEELSLDENAEASVAANPENAETTDEFSDFDQQGTGQSETSKPSENASNNSGEVSEGDLALENELNNLDSPTQPEPSPAPPAEVAVTPEPVAPVVEPPVPEMLQPELIAEQPIPDAPPVQPEVSQPEPQKISQINSIDYKSNDSGGTVLIQANQPLQFTTRVNSATNQLIVEVQNSVVPKKLKRSLNTKDMASSIGSIDIYQKQNSKISRFVIQLRPGAPEPLVQPEGNSLLIVGGANPSYTAPQTAQNEQSAPENVNVSEAGEIAPDMSSEGIMSTQSLEDFLMSNNRFYGKKISIETNNLDVKDAIKFIAEESGVNMILDEGLEGKVSLKLRQVPWDQALVLLLKSKKLGYKRQGNVLRIAKIDDIRREEFEGISLKEAKENTEALVVKRFFIGYADIRDLETKIKEFLFNTTAGVAGAARGPAQATDAATPLATQSASRARVISDARTSSIIVTDTQSNMIKIEKLIAALDTQPQQVLIEGKVVEAREQFSRQVGVIWSNNPSTAPTINRGVLSITPDLGSSQAIFSGGLTWGQLDLLGDLSAKLQLGEREDKARVLSSPRITVLSNQTATISQTSGILIPKISTATPSTGGGNTVTTTNEVVPVGVMLKVTPQVSNEGTVSLDMDIERSFLSISGQQTPDRRNAKTKVIVKSGQTAVIGGIFESETLDGVSGVPGLKDIPILGSLFRGKDHRKTKNELIIFITPRILQPIAGDKKTSTFE